MLLFSPTLQLSSPNSNFLENFDFLGFEQPDGTTFGKEQSSHKHVLIGGGRVIDLLGAGDPDITWSGFFSGTGSIQRAQFLEGMAAAGTQLTLTAGQFIKQVVITRFTYKYRQVFPIPYSITIQVVQDQTLPVPFLVPGDLTTTVLEALIQADDIAQLVANPSITNSIALALIAANAAAPLNLASVADINAALSTAQNAQSAVSTAITSASNSIFPSSPTEEEESEIPNPAKLPDLALESTTLIELDHLYQIQTLLNAYVINNILLVNTAGQAQQQTFFNPNLYSLAVQFYGDDTFWTVIANANNLTDPKVSTGFVSLLIPPRPTNISSGILNPTTQNS